MKKIFYQNIEFSIFSKDGKFYNFYGLQFKMFFVN